MTSAKNKKTGKPSSPSQLLALREKNKTKKCARGGCSLFLLRPLSIHSGTRRARVDDDDDDDDMRARAHQTHALIRDVGKKKTEIIYNPLLYQLSYRTESIPEREYVS